MMKKDYVAPTITVVKVQVQWCLLAGSGNMDASIEEGKLDDFPEDLE